MNAFEFTGKIENGLIRIPQSYLAKHGNGEVQVLVFIKPANGHSLANKKANLRTVLLKAPGQNLFSDIQEPVLWQKKLRDEWE